MKNWLYVTGTYDEGKIVAAEETPGRGWVEFDAGELEGIPHQIPVPPEVRPGAGELLFHYQIQETGERFLLRYREGADAAVLLPIVGSAHLQSDPITEDDEVYRRPDNERPPNRTGLENAPVGSAAYSFVRWGKCRPRPRKQEPRDPLRYDSGVDILRRGM